MLNNGALAAWRAGRRTVGGWLALGNVHAAEAMAHAGFDWLCIDLQHGLVDHRDLLGMLPAITTTGTPAFVRVSTNEPGQIMKVLDAGAIGVIVPLVDDRAEALRAIAACRYPPEGSRSFGPIRAALAYGPGYGAAANREIACIAMIETRAGLDNIEEIVTAPGLDGIYIGPNDLALSLGLLPGCDIAEPQHFAAVAHIQQVCRSQGMPVGIHADSALIARQRLEAGFHFVTIGSDAGFVNQGAKAALAEVHDLKG